MVETNELTAARGAGLPVRPEKRLADAVAEFMPAYDRLRDGLLERRPADVRDALARLRPFDVAAISRGLAAGRAPAAAVEIEAAVGKLIAVTKHLEKVDGPMFFDTLVEFISEENPTRLGLPIALRRVLLSARFTPSIAEVIDLLKTVEADLRSAATRLESLPDRIKEAETFLIRST